MRCKLFPLFVIVLVCAFSAAAQTVNESATTIQIRDKAAKISLAVESDSAKQERMSFDLLDKANTVLSSVSTTQSLSAGKNICEAELPLDENVLAANADLPWYRLRYRVGNAVGILSFSQIVRDLFELRVAAMDQVLSGTTYRVRVRALNPFTLTPQDGVDVKVQVELDLRQKDDKKLGLTGSARTDSDGFAVVDFSIQPDTQLFDDGEITVTGTKNGVTREATEEIHALSDDVQFLMLTDKPIYQPDQTVNFRGILLKGGDERTVVPNAKIEFRITDEDNTVLFREEKVSSEFGIASAEWRIPSNAKLGSYRIEVRNENDDQISGRNIKISRYDLPNFTVTAKPAKAYYVVGDKRADVEVWADYLFGKPVTKGRVRVVEEKSREWNWEDQKYDIEEGQIKEGETDADGKFHADFDLKEGEDELKKEDWTRFRDIHFAAYFTDPTTNRTEQRRFDIRVTREPIHVYFVTDDNERNPTLPLRGYISTFYADGTPAECDVEIKARVEDEGKFRSVTHVRTNSLGAVLVAMARPKIGDSDDNLDFEVRARDKKGLRGTRTTTERFDDDYEGLDISIDRAIYRPGETIHLSIQSTRQTGTVFVDVVSGFSPIYTKAVSLTGGRAEIEIPYSDKFKGPLGIVAFIEKEDKKDSIAYARTGAIFPSASGVRVIADFDKSEYRPSDEARLRFDVTNASGNSLASALGVVIVDQAVEERARTDADFAGTFSDYGGYLGYGESFAGINLKDLQDLDLTKQISPEMQVAARIILRDRGIAPDLFHSLDLDRAASSVFADSIKNQFEPIDRALRSTYHDDNYLHPVDDQGLRNILGQKSIVFDQLHDPWGIQYRTVFSVDRTDDVFTATSAGPDKKFDTDDDFNAYSTSFLYFVPRGNAVDQAVKNYYLRTDEMIGDYKTLLKELGAPDLRDRFGHPYQVKITGSDRSLKLTLRSAGKDGKFDKKKYYGDDFDVWTSAVDVYQKTEDKIRSLASSMKPIPINESDFREGLISRGLDLDKVHDGYGRTVYVTASQRSRYWDKITFETVENFGKTDRTERPTVTPVTQQIVEFDIRSAGMDGKVGSYDDTTLSNIVFVLKEESRNAPKVSTAILPTSFNGGALGSIAGLVVDSNGAVVANATVTATGQATGATHNTTSSASGTYLISGLAPDTYTLKVRAANFKDAVVQGLVISGSQTLTENVTLSAGSVSETVDVMALPELSQTNQSSVNLTAEQIQALPVNGRRFSQLFKLRPGTANIITKSGTSESDFTPRVREYFPETLYWQPELITDSDGKAHLTFKVADTITTWKMYAVASTKDGKIGVTQKDFTAFQPFFVDLDPPKFLTEGDEIYLPTQVRNYTSQDQKVDVKMDRADWFSMLGSEKQRVDVKAGDSQNAVFGFRAESAIKDGKQRVTAIAQSDSDAIEKPVTVRPNGQEVVHTDSNLFTGEEKLNLTFPNNARPKTQRAELKIYPNLYSHIAGSVEGLLERPYGCGEQTISSTYPNLMLLKFVKPDSILASKAKKYLQKGYARLLGYQAADGGFSYWGGKSESDIALTAYAIRFLTDAGTKMDVDQTVTKRAEDWLIKQQRPDGSWLSKHYWQTVEDPSTAKLTTTYVARSLAMRKTPEVTALTKALAYLRARNAEIDEPYALALYGLASLDAGDSDTAVSVAKRLEPMAIGEGDSDYWKLETNTPFYGWGTAGRVETTALVTQLLIRTNQKAPNQPRQELINKATLFLLKNKDRYGVWYSTQTTINVLDAFIAAIGTEASFQPQRLDILLNGAPFKSVDIPSDQIEALDLDLTGKLNASKNDIEIRSSGNFPVMSQLVTSHYVDWKDSLASSVNLNTSRALSLDYKCDKTNARIMDEVTCSVRAERIGFQGYGMLLAEIGTPPGADVSRESLEKAVESDWSISHYEILPDRIVVYMWANAGGTSFNFKFHPRYGINAQTPASVAYDYYNPEAQATVAPLRFSVK